MKRTIFSTWALLSATLGWTIPEQPRVIAGEANIHEHPGQLQICTSDRAIIHWKEFGIGNQEIVHFVQPNSSSAVLNRVQGGQTSHLLGQLTANGKVYLINPSGIIVGPNAVIRTAEFLASTHDIVDIDFLMNRDLLFQGDSEAPIVNYGTIEAVDGHITILGRFIDNQGSLVAPNGQVSMIAGQEILLCPQKSPLISIRPSVKPDSRITHAGKIEALVANLQSEGQAFSHGINLEGSVVALKTVESNGQIYLKSDGIVLAASSHLEASGGTVSIESTNKSLLIDGHIQAAEGEISIQTNGIYAHLGTLDVSGEEGGEIHIETTKFLNGGNLLAEGSSLDGGKIGIRTEGPYIETGNALLSTDGKLRGGEIHLQSGCSLFSSAHFSVTGESGGEMTLHAPNITLATAEINASGKTVGGQVLIGGGPHGEERMVPNAKLTRLSGDTRVSASGEEGGTIVVWSDETTVCYGSIAANGKHQGGWIEVSGRGDLYCAANLSANASEGVSGTILLDPKNIVINAVTGIYPQYELIDPNAGGGTGFGTIVTPLSTGNVVVTKPGDNLGGSSAGAVYLYNGLTAQLLSTLVGSQPNDRVGIDQVFPLTNGNYVIRSTFWNNGVATEAGAVTWGSGTVGISGVVSSGNSLVGTVTNDHVGRPNVLAALVALTNGNYVVRSPLWHSSTGAVTWGGPVGVSGNLSVSNSLVGTTPGELVGGSGAFALPNGNYVALSPQWGGGATLGAVTWANGTTGLSGTLSSSNSLVGATTDDQVGSNGIIILANSSNFVALSSGWDNGGIVDAGAATWINGSTGLTGTISSGNSLIGQIALDAVGAFATALTNGHYVVNSPNWNNGGTTQVGAVTWANGNGSTTGTVTAGNSIIGAESGDRVGNVRAIALPNGHYVIRSTTWKGGGTQRGAATWANGNMPTSAVVGLANSLVGTNDNDAIGSQNITALPNSNYVVQSPSWQDDTGAVTLGNGTNGSTVGSVTAINSFVGTNMGDRVGSAALTLLANGNYVVLSPSWNGGVGAATFGNNSVSAGAVSSSNSLVGSTAGDFTGATVIALNNGNYVVRTPNWDNGGISNTGAVTFGNGMSGITGTINSTISLVGSTMGDAIGTSVIPLQAGGHYVVASPNWDNGATMTMNVGAVTFGNGTTGINGPVTSSNSMVGVVASDGIGNGLTALSNGNYVIVSSNWDNGVLSNAGAATFGNNQNIPPIAGQTITSQNSITGTQASTNLSTTIASDTTNGTFLASFLAAGGSGKVIAGLQDPSQLTFARDVTRTITIAPSFITNTLNTGTNVQLQASNDISIGSAIGSTGSGSLGISAGRSIAITANLTTNNGDVTITANDVLASGVIDTDRDAGAAVLTIGPGVLIDTGTGDLTLSLLDGEGLTNSTSGNVMIGDNATLSCAGPGSLTIVATDHDVVLGDQTELSTVDGLLQLTAGVSIESTGITTLETTGSGELILLSDNLFPIPPAFGSGAVDLGQANLATNGGKLLIYTALSNLNTLPSTINGTPFIPGPEFVNSPTEKWGVYYPNSSGVPFTVFYKNSGFPPNPPPPPNPPTPPTPPTPPNPPIPPTPIFSIPIQGFYDMITAIAGTFQNWTNPWFNDLFFSCDRYPPYLTPKALRLRLPPLVTFSDTVSYPLNATQN